jgi:hypothetical protein
VSDAIAAYHDLLGDDILAAESVGVLQGGQLARNLFFGRHPLCTSVRPNLLHRARYDRVVAASESVHDAFATLEQALLADADLRAKLDLDPAEEELALIDTGVTTGSPSSRLDGFFADELRYVEYNAEQPAGMAYGDHLTEVFDTLPVMREFRRTRTLTALRQRDHQFDAMMRAFHEWGGGGSSAVPVMAILDWAGLPTQSEFEMFRDYFESRGVRTHIAQPDQLEFRDGTLYADGHAVNLIFKRLLTTELIDSQSDAYHVLRDAYMARAFCSVNPFRAKLLDKKMSLALLSDERYAELYTAAQRRAIDRHVPWTRKVHGGPATRHGQEIPDLLAYLCTHRHELVLKPNDEYGGKGVVLGWTVDDSEWSQAVEVATTQSYVVQETVPTPKECFPVALGDEVHFLDLSVDLDPYMFYGRVGGCLTRLSSSALLNVTAGSGSAVPTYIIE